MAKRKPILEPDTNYASVPVAEEAASDESQGSPLLDDDPLYIDIDQPVYSGTVLSSCINITNTILGSGMLAMPSAFAATGLGLGCLLVIVAATCSAIGLLMLSKVASLVGRKSSFFACSGITYPYAAVWFDLAIAIKCFGVSVSYLVICGDLLPQVVAGFMPWVAADSIWRTKLLWITFCIFGISPTCFLTRLDSLRYTSAFALTAVFYLLFVVIVFFISPPATGMPFPMPKLSEIVWFSLDSKLVSHLPIFVFAFTWLIIFLTQSSKHLFNLQ